jgi:spoIIIJ-associated protein
MEWVETSGKSVEDATELALNELGVSAADAEVEVLEEPKAGLFGRTRGNARVKARVAPKSPRPKNSRDRKRSEAKADNGSKSAAQDTADAKSSDDAGSKTSNRSNRDGGSGSERGGRDNNRDNRTVNQRSGRGQESSRNQDREPMPADEQVRVGTKFLEGLVTSFGVEAEVTGSLHDDGVLAFDVNGEGLGLLIGPGLGTLESIQEVCRNSIQHEADGREYGKVRLDVAGARAQRTEALMEFVRAEAAKVDQTGDEVSLEPMSRMDRKVVHDLVGEMDGLDSSSVGEEPRRQIVIHRV